MKTLGSSVGALGILWDACYGEDSELGHRLYPTNGSQFDRKAQSRVLNGQCGIR